MKKSFALALVLALPAVPSIAADWPQWQGPDRDAISEETGLLQQWPEGGPPLAWKAEGIGAGMGGVAVADGRIYTSGDVGGTAWLFALNEAHGELVWKAEIGRGGEVGRIFTPAGPRATPTVDGDRLYILSQHGDLVCFTTAGNEVWRTNLVEDHGGIVPVWGYSESPLVEGEKLICTPGALDATLIALDKLTGKAIWRSEVPVAADDEDDGNNDDDRSRGRSGRGRSGRGGRGESRSDNDRRPSLMQVDPVLKTLDADGNGEISTPEIDASPGAIGKLDKNADGKLTADEVAPDFGDRGRRGGPRGPQSPPPGGRDGEGERPRFNPITIMPANKALDADENGEIDTSEISNSVTALRTLDKNSDGTLTEDEVRPQFGGRGRGSRGPESGASYSSAIAIDFKGQRQYVQVTAKTLAGFSPTDGKLLWQYDRPVAHISCSTPIHQDGLVFASAAYEGGGGAVRLTKSPDGSAIAKEVYFTPYMRNHHGGMIVVDGCLYGTAGGNEGGFLVCLDFQTGDVLWRERRAPKGSLLLADGRLYLRAESGTMILFEPDRQGFVEHGRFEQPGRSEEPAWTHPVIANGKLYIRDQSMLFCYDVRVQ